VAVESIAKNLFYAGEKMLEHTEMKIRPYARLLTMLGDQLIKNERIALIELIKNSYDADSPWVKVSFKSFGDSFEIFDDTRIVIEDAGTGMSIDTINNHWLNPATPEKRIRKLNGKSHTKLGRIIQGEKGIGRFALLKLGKVITVITKTLDSDVEYVVEYDFSMFDEDFIEKIKDKSKALFLDELSVKLSTREPGTIVEKEITLGIHKIIRPACGTKIIVSDLKGKWSQAKIESVSRDITRLQSIFYDYKADKVITSDFITYFYVDNNFLRYNDRYLEELKYLLDNSSVFRITNGEFNQSKAQFKFLINGNPMVLNLEDPTLKGLKIFERSDGFDSFGDYLSKRQIDCGSFDFSFYIFDFSSQAPPKFALDNNEKTIIRDHRVYLYRDGIRVYPYGEPDDDWLRIDSFRGTVSAGQFLSNDQVVGCVNITQSGNPKLKDKTNREGLIEEGYATENFITLIKLFLAYIRSKPYARYRQGLVDQKAHDIHKAELVKKKIEDLKIDLHDNKSALLKLTNIEKAYTTEKTYLVKRAEDTEDLAGIGLSVETATHDINSLMSSALSNIDGIIKDLMYGKIDTTELKKEMHSLRGMLSFIEAQLKDIQLLFKSTKQRRKKIRVKDYVEKIERIYKRVLTKECIVCEIITTGSPLVANTTDAVLLQLLLNLFDNSIYWLKQTSVTEKKIVITLNGIDSCMIFSDSGPGVESEDIPYIFEPFYSGKGEEGRGLGLYIAKQLLARHDYSIELTQTKRDMILHGANFKVNFIQELE